MLTTNPVCPLRVLSSWKESESMSWIVKSDKEATIVFESGENSIAFTLSVTFSDWIWIPVKGFHIFIVLSLDPLAI